MPGGVAGAQSTMIAPYADVRPELYCLVEIPAFLITSPQRA